MPELNLSLYNALSHFFGSVAISASGENYAVNCPFCGDQRKRLSIHHTWGTYEPGNRWPSLGRAICFNENCMKDQDHPRQLFEMVFAMNGIRSRRKKVVIARPHQPRQPTISPRQIITELPQGDYIPVHQLKPHDEARLYLEQRGFDCEELWQDRRVMYCQIAPDSQPRIDDRLVVPYFTPPPTWDCAANPRQLRLVGYIARRPSADQPFHAGLATKKYLLPGGFSKSQYLYGIEQAIGGESPVMICEGVTDVWRLRRNAVALSGKTMSPEQKRLLLKHFTGRMLVVMLDDDAQEEALAITYQLREGRESQQDIARVVCLCPPPGIKDVGECTFEQIMNWIAKRSGYPLDWLRSEQMAPPHDWVYPAGMEAKRRPTANVQIVR